MEAIGLVVEGKVAMELPVGENAGMDKLERARSTAPSS